MSEDLMRSTLEEQIFWCDCVMGLPGLEGFSGTGKDKFGENIPWGTGPHSVKAFRETFEIINPKTVFEIGFNNGYASAVFLALAPEASVVSCDISMKDETIEGARILTEKHPDRFRYFNRGETFGIKNGVDLVFVDGGHLKQDVHNDIDLCLLIKAKYLLFDDVLPQFGQVQEVIDNFSQLELVKTWGNIALYKNASI